MPVAERLKREQEFHDRQAEERARLWSQHPDALRFEDDSYLDHEDWIRPAFAELGDVKGRSILDLGCGHAMASIVLARRGANVVAMDLSRAYLREARARAHANGVDIELVHGSGEALPFVDGAFDGVWGNAILHHLDLRRAGAELHRVLKPGGVAVFCEPWGDNPLLSWARRRLPYPGKHRTVDEQPLLSSDLPLLVETFPNLKVQGFQLLSMAGRMLGKSPVQRGLIWADGKLLRCFPRLQTWCRYVVLTMTRTT